MLANLARKIAIFFGEGALSARYHGLSAQIVNHAPDIQPRSNPMARMARAEVFTPEEIAIVHVINRVVRRCFLMGLDEYTGKNYDHRKRWIEDELQRVAAFFGIDLLCFAILSNHS